MKQLSIGLSWVFSPLLIPIYGLLIVLFLPVDAASYLAINSLYLLIPKAKILYLLLFVVFIVIAPWISILVVQSGRKKVENSYTPIEKRQTQIALTTFYLIVLFIFLHLQAEGAYIPFLLKSMVLGGTLAGLICYFSIHKKNSSFHSVGAGTLVGFITLFTIDLAQIPLELLVAVILLAGFVGSARIVLRKHTVSEIGIGFFVGFLSQIAAGYLYSYAIYYLYTFYN